MVVLLLREKLPDRADEGEIMESSTFLLFELKYKHNERILITQSNTE
jgi:hypothetical protein